MAWIFLPGGLIMPSQTPMDEADFALTLGYRDIQVRARLTEHLEYFIRTYMQPMELDFSEIEQTPHMDYNCRLYTTREDLAKAVGAAMMDIDYRKFKPTAEGIDPTTGKPFAKGALYHGVLNSIWGSLLRLAPAGGVWGPRTKDNPNGYRSSGRVGRGVQFHDDELESEDSADAAWWEQTLLDGDGYQEEASPVLAETRRSRRTAAKGRKRRGRKTA